MASPAGIVLSARQDVTLGAEQAQGFYSQGPINLTSSQPLGITAKKGLRIHAEAGGLKQVISDGDYTVHVQDGEPELFYRHVLIAPYRDGCALNSRASMTKAQMLVFRGADAQFRYFDGFLKLARMPL